MANKTLDLILLGTALFGAVAIAEGCGATKTKHLNPYTGEPDKRSTTCEKIHEGYSDCTTNPQEGACADYPGAQKEVAALAKRKREAEKESWGFDVSQPDPFVGYARQKQKPEEAEKQSEEGKLAAEQWQATRDNIVKPYSPEILGDPLDFGLRTYDVWTNMAELSLMSEDKDILQDTADIFRKSLIGPNLFMLGGNDLTGMDEAVNLYLEICANLDDQKSYLDPLVEFFVAKIGDAYYAFKDAQNDLGERPSKEVVRASFSDLLNLVITE